MVFLVSEALGPFLTSLELQDTVLFETVDLNSYLPLLSGPAPTTRSTHTLLKRDSITKASIAAGRQRPQPEESNSHEKEALVARRAELEIQIELKNRRLKELQLEKQRLEDLRADQTARSRIGSRLQARAPRAADAPDDDAAYWKRAYLAAEKKFEDLQHALSAKGAWQRVSVARSRQISPPRGAPRFDETGEDGKP
jgi:hypothetical protein